MKLTPDRLKKTKSPSTWKISTTNDIHLAKSRKPEPLIGQQRAFEAMEFGLRVDERGYNIFVVGQPGSGRTSYVLERLQELAVNLPAPDDWLYLYNFARPGEPIAVSVPAGKGRKLSDDLDELLSDLKTVISRAFEQSQYEETKTGRIKEFQEKAGAIMDKLKARAEREHFSLKRTPQGFVNIPLVKDKDEEGKDIVRELKPEEYEALDASKQNQAKSEKISQRTLTGMRQIRDMEKALKETLSKLDAEMCRSAISPIMEELRGDYAENEALQRWFDAMTDDIIENFGAFVTAARDENAEVDFTRYQANLFVSNDPSKGAPVIWETSPTYYNLSGRVEYESHQGYLYTDFRRVLAGAFHKANGGFLVLDAEKVLMNFMAWEAIKRILRTGEAAIENLGEQYGALPVASLRPSAIPMDIKIIMTGTAYIYELLQYYDAEFGKIFKVKASFDYDMPRTAVNERKMSRYIAEYVKRRNLKPFDASALSEIIEWSGREAEDQNLLSADTGRLRELLTEASAWSNTETVTRSDVIRAVEHRNYRLGLYREKLARAFSDGVIRVDTSGEGAITDLDTRRESRLMSSWVRKVL